MTVIVVAIVLCGGLAAWIAAQKNRGQGEGLALGLLFGPLGVLVEALLPEGKLPPPVAYQFKPRKMLGPIDESRALRKVD